MKSVRIIETRTGTVKFNVPVQITGLSYTPTRKEYETAAWEAAVDEGSVDPDRYSDYTFEIEDPTIPASPAPAGTPA
jgi:hypothetical protein